MGKRSIYFILHYEFVLLYVHLLHDKITELHTAGGGAREH